MSQLEIKSLFHRTRFPDGVLFFLFILYVPIGVLLSVFRLFFGLHVFCVSCVLPKTLFIRKYILRCLWTCLGVVMTTENCNISVDENSKILVANHVSVLDYVVIGLSQSSLCPNIWEWPEFISKLLGFCEMGSKDGREALVASVKQHLDKPGSLPVFVHPERSTTSSKAALMKFSTWPFSLGYPVQPMLIKLRRPPVADIAPSVLGSTWLQDFVWFLFVPYTHFHIRMLPSMVAEESESSDDFSKRVQNVMAQELNIRSSNYTAEDKLELIKREYTDSQQASHHVSTRSHLISRSPSAVQKMVIQVKEVLPNVPDDVIMTDLGKTSDVDVTIMNILDGKVKYTPVTVPDTSDSDNSSSTVKSKPGSSNISSDGSSSKTVSPQKSPFASDFGRTPDVRQMSYQKKKEMMVEAARRAYMEKHGMV